MHGSYWKALVIQVWVGLLVLSDLCAQGNQQLDDSQTRHEGIPTPLTDQPGDAERGRHIVLDRERGDCVVCHALPLPERRFHGTVGLPLDNGSRYTAAELRLRLVDPKAPNPHSIMPAYHTVEGRHSVLEAYRGQADPHRAGNRRCCGLSLDPSSGRSTGC